MVITSCLVILCVPFFHDLNVLIYSLVDYLSLSPQPEQKPQDDRDLVCPVQDCIPSSEPSARDSRYLINIYE